MKRKSIIISIIFILFFISISGYSISISAGFKMGPGISNIPKNAKTDEDIAATKFAFNMGPICEIGFLDWLSVEVFLGWRNMGYKQQNPLTLKTETINLDYFHFEVTAKFYPFKISDKVRFYFLVGGYIGGTMKRESYHSKTDLGFTFGLGIKIRLKEKWNLLIETHGNFGFISIFERIGSPGWKNVAGYFNAGFLYDF